MITKDFIKKQRRKIEKKIEELKGELKKNRRYDDLGSTDEDKAKEFEDFEEKIALGKSAKTEIKNLESALERIDNSSYGKCAVDGEPIELSRLKAYPEARYCATHAKSKK
jgi:RNA polymerase-binding transcription factor DksA